MPHNSSTGSLSISLPLAQEGPSADNKPVIRNKSVLGEDINRVGKPTKIFIPNVLARWPWPRRINPNYTTVKVEADAWIMGFQAFTPKVQAIFNRCDFNLLACLAYPFASKEHVRTGCDFMHFAFLFDEYSDRSTPSEVRQQKEMVMDAFQNPHTARPEGEWVGAEVARQFWERAVQNATAISQKRFIQSVDECLEGIVQQSIDKHDCRILDLKSYIDLRYRTSGAKVLFSIYELNFDIPDEVMAHPAIQEMTQTACDLIALINDILSYNIEQSRGDDLHNILTCVMKEYDTDANGAILWVEDYLLRAADRFHTAMASLPGWEEPLDSQVRAYCDGLGQSVRASDEWSFESEKYFGSRGPEIRKNRWMTLLPKKHTTEIGPVHIDSFLL